MDERRPFLLIAWVLLLALFLWSVRPVLSPIVLALAIAYLLGPLFGTALYRRLIVIVGTLTLLWLLLVAGEVLAPFALALVLAYVAHPLVDWGERNDVGRGIGAAVVILLTGLALVGAIVLLVPIVRRGTGRACGRSPPASSRSSATSRSSGRSRSGARTWSSSSGTTSRPSRRRSRASSAWGAV